LKELIGYLASNLAERPEEVRVMESRDEKGPLLLLTVAPEDQSRLIGKEGRTIRAMRSLLAASAAKTGVRYVLKIAGGDLGPATEEDLKTTETDAAEGP
jgi:predicted RNA-binding protein YlqC (UPF0109 family)